jgi:ribosomal protein L20A (L18A)
MVQVELYGKIYYFYDETKKKYYSRKDNEYISERAVLEQIYIDLADELDERGTLHE